MKKILPIISIVLILATGIFAQPGPPPMGGNGPRREQLKQRLEIIKMWKLIENLKLTEEQSMKFFPLKNAHDEALREISRGHESVQNELEELLKSEDYPEYQLTNLIDSVRTLRIRKFEEEMAFMDGAMEILTQEQQAKLVLFERRFREEVRELIEMGSQKAGRGTLFRPK